MRLPIASMTLKRGLRPAPLAREQITYSSTLRHSTIGKKKRPRIYVGRTSHREENQSRRSEDGQASLPDQTFSSPRIEPRDEPPSLTY